MLARRVSLCLLAVFFTACSGWQPPAPPPEPTPNPPGPPDDVFSQKKKKTKSDRPAGPGDRFASLRDQLLARWIEDEPSIGRGLGLHRSDGRVANYESGALAARHARLVKERADLAAFDKEKLTPDEALDLAILEAQADLSIFEYAELSRWKKDPQFYQELFSVNDYLDRDYAPLEERVQKLLVHEKAALAEIAHVRQNLSGPMSKPLLETAIKIYQGYAEYLRGDAVKQTKGVGNPAFQDDLARTNEALAKEATGLADWMQKSELPRGDDSHILGPDRYRKLLKAQEGLTMPLAELKKMGEDNLRANKSAYEKLAGHAVQKRTKAENLFADAARITESAHRFIIEKHFVTVPTDEKLMVKETPPYQRWNSAFMNGPGPFEERGLQSFYYVTLPDPKLSKKEQEDYLMPSGTLLSTTIHETYPGHFLQALWIKRAPTRVQKSFSSYSFVEGWAHYIEQAMIELGYGAKDPANQLGQLADALLRNCRLVVSLGIHTEKMSLHAAELRFINDCKQDKATAHEQAVRGTFDPGYFAYTLGTIQILALREEAKRKLGQKFDLQKFHDALLSHGSPAVALIHDRVLADLGAK